MIKIAEPNSDELINHLLMDTESTEVEGPDNDVDEDIDSDDEDDEDEDEEDDTEDVDEDND